MNITEVMSYKCFDFGKPDINQRLANLIPLHRNLQNTRAADINTDDQLSKFKSNCKNLQAKVKAQSVEHVDAQQTDLTIRFAAYALAMVIPDLGVVPPWAVSTKTVIGISTFQR